jgi:hypothetical protein
MMWRTGNWRCWRGAVSLTRGVDGCARFFGGFSLCSLPWQKACGFAAGASQAGAVRLDPRPTLIVPFLVSTELDAERLRRQ